MSVAPAPVPVHGAVRPGSPFVGLVPFDEQDAPFFFGRGQEAAIVASNLRSTRLTILYGPSGVGKSSLLMAGAVHELREEARTAAAESPFAVCVFRSWRGDPAPGVEEAAGVALAELGETGPPDATLAETLRAWTEGTGTLLVVLDQFEEYFQYHLDEDDGERLTGFAAELARLVNDPSLPVHVLLSIREDALAKLDRFEGHIPSLFSNYLRVEHLDRAAARRAIEGPITAWNGILGDDEPPYEIEPALVDEVIAAAVGGRLVFASDGDAGAADAARDRVEAPFLQLVLERLWRDAIARGDRTLTVARLEALGGARRIVENHLLDALGALTPAEQEVAADSFRFLVTRSKTKIAHPASDLADWTNRPEAEVEAVLSKLAGAESGRILRAVAPATDDGGGESYELFHDVLAEPILDWRRAYDQDRERRRVRRRFLRIGGILLAVIAVVGALGIWALIQRHDAKKSAQATKWLSVAVSARDLVDDRLPEALLLGLEANEHSESEEARNAMTLALEHARRSGVSAALGGPSGVVRAVAFSPDGRTLATTGSDGGVHLWNVRTRRQAGAPLTAPDLESSVAFSPDGRTLATGGSDGSIRLWDPHTHRTIGTLKGHTDEVTTVAFSPDGRTLASAGFDETVRLWDVRSQRPLGGPLESGFSPVYGLAFSPDRGLVAVAGAGGAVRSVRLWDTRTRVQHVLHAVPANAATGVAFSHDGRWLVAAGTDGAVRVWDVQTGALRRTLRGSRGSIFTSVAVSRPGVVAASTTDGEAWLWRLESGTPIGAPLQADSSTTRALAFSPDGRTLATGGSVARLWDVATHDELGAPLAELRSISYHGVTVSPTGTLAALDRDGSVRLWSIARNSPVRQTVKVDPSTSAITFTPDGRLVAAGKDGVTGVWEIGTGKRVDTLHLGERPVGVAVSHDARTLAAVNLTADVSLWDLGTGKKLEPLAVGRAAFGSVAFAPDGHTLALGAEDGTVRVGDLRDPGGMRSFPAGQGYVYAVAFSPDGRLLATSGQDGTVRLWDVRTLRALGVPLAPLTPRRRAISGVAFSGDGRTIVTAGIDGTVRLWRGILWSGAGDLETRVCGLVSRVLGESDWRKEWSDLAPGLAYEPPCPAGRAA